MLYKIRHHISDALFYRIYWFCVSPNHSHQIVFYLFSYSSPLDEKTLEKLITKVVYLSEY